MLRNNFWLVTHVLTITLSYAAFALALGIADIALGYYLARSKNREVLELLSTFIYKTLQVGVLLLAVGTVLGSIWADYAWGRFWGWDPKEVWALIALLGYLALLHARYTGWLGNFGLAACAAACFSLVIVAWYGVNFVLGPVCTAMGSAVAAKDTCWRPYRCNSSTWRGRTAVPAASDASSTATFARVIDSSPRDCEIRLACGFPGRDPRRAVGRSRAPPLSGSLPGIPFSAP